MKRLEDMAEQIGISKLILMENAGSRLAKIIKKRYLDNKSKKIMIICGSGNNGGDGLVCARHLLGFSDEITVCLLNTNGKLKTYEIETNWKIINNIKQIKKIEFFQNKRFVYDFEQEINRCDIIIDALFGTGLHGNLKNHFEYVINQINKSNKSIISVDVPSGLNPSDGSFIDNVVKSELTVTFHKVKSGLLGKNDITGEIVIADIGIPPELENNL